jgi:hypothetical protein
VRVAWVFGGITRVLQDMPLSHPSRPQWIEQFREMAASIKAEQGFNSLYSGLWTTSMRDHTQWPDPESSGSAFFCFGMAWGINNHILDSAQYIDCVRKAWRDLVANVGSDGRLRRCENVDVKPAAINADNSSVEGEGAFMQAAEQLWKMATGTTGSLPISGLKGKIPRRNQGADLDITGYSGKAVGVQGTTHYNLQGRHVPSCQPVRGKDAGVRARYSPLIVVPE